MTRQRWHQTETAFHLRELRGCRARALLLQKLSTIAEACLSIMTVFIMGYSLRGFELRTMIAGVSSVLRALLASVASMGFDANGDPDATPLLAPGYNDTLSIEDADRLRRRLIVLQRMVLWCVNTQSMVVIWIHISVSTAPLRSPQPALLDPPDVGKAQWITIFCTSTLLLVNVGIWVLSCAVLCRSEWLAYANLVPSRSRLLRPTRLRVTTYEELLPKLQAAPSALAASGCGPVVDESLCVICLSDFQGPDVVAELPCGHFFHDGCARLWFVEQPQCPYRCKDSSTAIAESLEASTVGFPHQRDDSILGVHAQDIICDLNETYRVDESFTDTDELEISSCPQERHGAVGNTQRLQVPWSQNETEEHNVPSNLHRLQVPWSCL